MVPALHCDSEATWQHGNSLVNYMKMAEVEGLTGPVKFDQVRCWCGSDGDPSLYLPLTVGHPARLLAGPGGAAEGGAGAGGQLAGHNRTPGRHSRSFVRLLYRI